MLTVSKTGQSERLPVKKIIKKNFITKDLLKTLGDPEEELELRSLTKLLLIPGISSEFRREPRGSQARPGLEKSC